MFAQKNIINQCELVELHILILGNIQSNIGKYNESILKYYPSIVYLWYFDLPRDYLVVASFASPKQTTKHSCKEFKEIYITSQLYRVSECNLRLLQSFFSNTKDNLQKIRFSVVIVMCVYCPPVLQDRRL